MNSSEIQANVRPSDPTEEGRLAVLQQFNVEDIQRLGQNDLLVAQSLAGHGEEWGRWLTPKSISPGHMAKHSRDIDLARRLNNNLNNNLLMAASADRLIEEGVLLLTRLALIARLAPSAGKCKAKTSRLKPNSIAQKLDVYWPRLAARAIHRKANDSSAIGLLRYLAEEDIIEFNAYKRTRIEVERLNVMVARGLWSDMPSLPGIRQTTAPAAKIVTRPSQEKPEPYPPIPDTYLAEIGPRVLWIVQEMGPNLLRLLADLPQELESIKWSSTTANISKQASRRIMNNLERNKWLSLSGNPLEVPFRLSTSSGRNGANLTEWPPRNLEHVVTLSLTLQTAHLFIILLASGGRIGEIATLTRNCVRVRVDGKSYLRGFTYKLSDNLFGEARQWPAPPILCQCLGQQARLAEAWDWLPSSCQDGLPRTPRFGEDLWVSIGTSGRVGEGAQINFNQALQNFAERLDMDSKPGGRNLHAHRFRKTMGRLAGIALFNSPLVLKRLLGHKSIEMTLHYILCDPGVREEAEKVLRELRIMHCAETLQEIHQDIQAGQLPGNGGPGAARLVTAVRNEEEQLRQSGRVWDEGSAYDLAYLLTAQGKGWRLIKENIICTKTPGEDGLCQKNRSKEGPNTANCKPDCSNRFVHFRERRDTELKITQYLDIARKARDGGQVLVLASVMENLREELEHFSDLREKYRDDSEIQSLFALCEEPEMSEGMA